MKNVTASDKDKLALIGHTSTEMLRHYQDVNLEDLAKNYRRHLRRLLHAYCTQNMKKAFIFNGFRCMGFKRP